MLALDSRIHGESSSRLLGCLNCKFVTEEKKNGTLVEKEEENSCGIILSFLQSIYWWKWAGGNGRECNGYIFFLLNKKKNGYFVPSVKSSLFFWLCLWLWNSTWQLRHTIFSLSLLPSLFQMNWLIRLDLIMTCNLFLFSTKTKVKWK